MPTQFQRPDQVADPLYIVTVVFNPQRWRSRWKLYQDFAKRCDEGGARLLTVEVAFGDRAFAITDPDNRWQLQLRTSDEFWLKENALNLGIARLPVDWKYVAWADADVAWMRDDWANETVHQLQHYPVVQMFGDAIDLDSNNAAFATHKGFARAMADGDVWQGAGYPYGPYSRMSVPGQTPGSTHHTGYAWAYRRQAINDLGGLFDVDIAGSGDWQMGWGFFGKATTMSPRMSQSYRLHLARWQSRAQRFVGTNVGYVPGTLMHYWHGSKADRKYIERKLPLVESQYDPDIDLKRDWQGLYQLTDRSPTLRDGLRWYARVRNEDAPT